MRIKCIYCGNEAVLNPYELMEMSMQQAAMAPVEEVPVEPVIPQQPLYTQPYDVSQDLNFDDIL